MIEKRRNTGNLIPCHPLVERLRSSRVFHDLSVEQLIRLSRATKSSRWYAGAIIVAQNEAPRGLYLVCSGSAKAVVFGENGREVTVAQLEAGDIYGETAILGDGVLGVSLVASTEATVLTIGRDALLDVLHANPDVSLRLLHEMAVRQRRADEMIGSLALKDVATRLRKTLLSLAEESGETTNEGLLIKRRPTQQDLANMVGTCRETVSRLLSSMARGGLIVAKGRSLFLSHDLVNAVSQAA